MKGGAAIHEGASVVAVENRAMHLRDRIVADDHEIEVAVIVVIAPGGRGPDQAQEFSIRNAERAAVVAIDARNPAIVRVAGEEQVEVAVVVIIAPRRRSPEQAQQSGIRIRQRSAIIPVNASDPSVVSVSAEQ